MFPEPLGGYLQSGASESLSGTHQMHRKIVLVLFENYRPVIGGTLTRPAIEWPHLFGKFQFFHTYPYFLPCAAAAAITFVSCLCAGLVLQEVS